MSQWDATLIYYTISAPENSIKFFKVILRLALLMFSFIPTLLSNIPSSFPPKYSDASSPCSVLAFNMHSRISNTPAHRTGWEHPECIKFSKASQEWLLSSHSAGSSPTHCTVTGTKTTEVGGIHPLLALSTGQKKMRMFMVEPRKKQILSHFSYEHSAGKQILDYLP